MSTKQLLQQINGMCNVRPQASDKFVVAPSTIPKAGKGLFAAVNIPKGTVLGHYTGKVLSTDEQEPDSAYMLIACTRPSWLSAKEFEAKKDKEGCVTIDGAVDGSILGYANDNADENAINADINDNATFTAARDIEKGEEIFVDYGEHYWDE
ncbi:SET domain-containing protein-lysine N-methyltransferase [bacterium]|nr:SET domain-containing protein-lysine N-methyltransferase [bacterium]